MFNDLFEELVREYKDCPPDERIKLARGYARVVDLKVADLLRSIHGALLVESTNDVLETLESTIQELQTGKSVVGSTEGITGKLEV